MKSNLLFILIILSTFAFGQQDSLPNKQALIRSIDFPYKRTPYLFNKRKDTLLLSPIENSCSCSSVRIVKRVQINNQGNKERLLYRQCVSKRNKRPNRFNIKGFKRFKHYELWDLDNKKLLFQATNYIKVKAFSILENKTTVSYYRYQLNIDKNGLIHIKNFKTGARYYIPDKKVGSYYFKYGQYNFINPGMIQKKRNE